MAESSPIRRSRWWQWFLPVMILQPDVQVLLISRLLSELGIATLTYGAMVHIARAGAGQIEVTLLTTAGALAALIFGLRGGAIADSMSKRVALGLGYLLQAALCVVVPHYLGTTFLSLLLLVFSVRLLTQIVSPAVKSAVVLVAGAGEIATAITLLTMAGGVGSGAGTALLAPMLIKLFDIRVMLLVVAVILLLAAIRTFRLPSERRSTALVDGDDPTTEATLSIRTAGAWLLANPALASIITSGAIVAVLNDVFESLQPIFVRDTLSTDPANSIYVFAPGLIGTVVAVLLSPLLVRWPGERWLIGLSLASFTLAMVLLGVIGTVAPYLAPYSPLHLLSPFGLSFSEPVLAAGLIGILVKFGGGAANTAVQSFINRRVGFGQQGAAFGMQNFLQNALGVVGTLGFGALANRYGTDFVFIAAPFTVVAIVAFLIRRSDGSTGRATEPGSGDRDGVPAVEEPDYPSS